MKIALEDEKVVLTFKDRIEFAWFMNRIGEGIYDEMKEHGGSRDWPTCCTAHLVWGAFSRLGLISGQPQSEDYIINPGEKG